MEQEIAFDLRRTNIFMRLVLFFFTLIIVIAAVALFFATFHPYSESATAGAFLLFFGLMSYGAAELTVSHSRLHRYGIEEGLVVCSVALLCLGLQVVFFGASSSLSLSKPNGAGFLVPAAGAAASLWIWRRFGLFYGWAAAMIFVAFVPGYWTSSHSARHLIVAGFYAAGLPVVAAARSRHRFDYLNERYSLAEAFLWIGVYLALNLQLSSLDLLSQWRGGAHAVNEFSKGFYWTTWVLIWALPPAILAKGLRGRDRFVIASGAIAMILTLITNKPYLGWTRHSWDPMVLGMLFIGVVLFVRRWLARGAGGIRRGFTAERLSGKDRQRMNAASAAMGLITPQMITASPHADRNEVRFGGGDSAGGGASGDF